MCNNCVEEVIEVRVEDLVNIQTGKKIDMEIYNSLKPNAMLKVKPELWIEWDFERNDELGLDIYKVTKGKHKKAYFICKVCGSLDDPYIFNKSRGDMCGYCRGFKVNHTNSLASLRPDIASQWHPTLNGDKTPHNFTVKSNEYVWWLCELGHHWEAQIYNRSNGNGCPYCCNKEVWVGFNDLWFTHPEIALLFANSEDGYKYTYGSNQKVDCKCSGCGTLIKGKKITDIKEKNLFCQYCSNSKSYPERFMLYLLKQIQIEFVNDTAREFSGSKRYDFYTEYNNMKIIIEMHGGQHIKEGFKTVGGRTLKEEQENDLLKYELAMSNGIDKYIVIDCEHSDFEYIKSNILNSELNEIFNLSNIDWNEIELELTKSQNLEVLELWNQGLSLSEISEKLKIHNVTLSKILRNYERIGKCVYDSSRGLVKYHEEVNEGVIIYQYDINMNLIKIWENVIHIRKELGYLPYNIKRCCEGNRKTAYKYIWKYEKDVI